MDINCEKIVENYLLIQNPLYAFSFPISILLAIILFGVAKAFKWSDNSYVNQILIPILGFLLSMVIIDLLSKMMISKEEKVKLLILCKQWLHDPKIKKNPHLINTINMDIVANYQVENFSNENEELRKNLINNIKETPQFNKNDVMLQHNSVENPIAQIPNINPFPLNSKPNGNTCIENSNCCNVCSGTNDNPCNLTTPIPGPQWMPQSADAVQNRLVNNDYTASKCEIK
jgi:hypothetical protein